MSSRDPAGTPAKSLSSVTVCGGFARFLSAHVLAALGNSRSWCLLHEAIFQHSAPSANNPRTNPSYLPGSRTVAAARHQPLGREGTRSFWPAGAAGVQRGGLITCAQLAPLWASPRRATSGTAPVAASLGHPKAGFRREYQHSNCANAARANPVFAIPDGTPGSH